ncbi:MAG: hypothetical protein LC739_06780 [Actinobacteria bacterium]|nr:hypothetical protein [Actinomycetota bacterium]
MTRVLGLKTEIDAVLGAVAPLGLAAAAGATSLVIDLDPNGPSYPGERSLAEVVAEGPRRVELTPTAGSVAVLRNGGVDWHAAAETVERLAATWPAIVLRVPPGNANLPWPVIPVVPLLPGVLATGRSRPAVWQKTDRGQRPPGPGPALPPLRRATLVSLLELRYLPARRWVHSWQAVWELPWP